MSSSMAVALRLVGWRGGLPVALRRAMAHPRVRERMPVPLDQVLTTPAAIQELLASPGVAVPYTERSQEFGLGDFPLADDGPTHRARRDLLVEVMAASVQRHRFGVETARGAARLAVQDAEGHLDVVGSVIEPALCRWVEAWFGLEERGQASGQPRPWGTDLLRAGQVIAHWVLLHPEESPPPSALAWIADRRAELVSVLPNAPANTIGGALVARVGAAAAADQVLGLTVGPLALGTWATVHVVRDLMGSDLDELGESVADLPRGGRKGDESARRAVRAALRRSPPLVGVVRTVPTRRRVPGRWGTVPVPAGTVLACTEAAVLDGGGGGPDGSGEAGLVFGSGPHACMGAGESVDVAAALVRALGRRRPRRAKGRLGDLLPAPAPWGAADWRFPGRLLVRLDG